MEGEERRRSLWYATTAMDSFCSCGSILHQQLYFSIPIGAETALMASEDGKEGRKEPREKKGSVHAASGPGETGWPAVLAD